MSILTRLFVVMAIAYALPSTAQSIRSQKPLYARLVYIKPKEGKADDFEKGYKRHLQWHWNNNDAWSWYGWTIASGEHTGEFMDGTFFRTTQELDNPVDPAGDVQHNKEHVSPYADFRNVVTLKFEPELSNHKGNLSQPFKTKFLKIYQVAVKADRVRHFDERLTYIVHNCELPCYTFKVVDGDLIPSYYILIPYDSNESLNTLSEIFYNKRLPEAPNTPALINSIQVNTYRFREDLSLLTDKP